MKSFYYTTILAMSLLPGAILQGQNAPQGSALTGSVRIHGNVIDRSTGRPAKASDIRLLSFENMENTESADGMQVLASLPQENSRFDFSGIPVRKSGYLLSLNYDHENFIKVIPLETVTSGAPVTADVYSRGAPADSVQITSMQLIKKLQKSLSVERAYVISNRSNPPRTYSTEKLRFHLPQGAKNLSASLKLEESGMTVPVGVRESEDGTYFQIDRVFQTGTSTLTVSFEYPSYELPDVMPDIISEDGSSPKSHGFRILSWKPDDAKPDVDGGESEELDIPNLGKLLKVSYPEQGEVILDFRKGGIYLEQGMVSAENPVYGGWKMSFTALIIFTALLFLIFIFINQKQRS